MKIYENEIERRKADMIIIGMKIDRLARQAPEIDAQIARGGTPDRTQRGNTGKRHAQGQAQRQLKHKYKGAGELVSDLPKAVREQYLKEFFNLSNTIAEEELMNKYIKKYLS